VLFHAAKQAAVVAISLLPEEEESVVPPQATSRVLDRPAMRPLMIVRFNFVSCIVELSKNSLCVCRCFPSSACYAGICQYGSNDEVFIRNYIHESIGAFYASMRYSVWDNAFP
jgi:hypothetical protein